MAGGTRIDATPPRALFAALVAGALGQTRVEPSPMATSYLVELLHDRIRAPGGPAADTTLAEALLSARLERGPERIRCLRGVGDRALFVAGFFGDRVSRGLVGLDYYGDVGRSAYRELSASLPDGPPGEGAWRHLFAELAGRFGDFIEVLCEVGDRTRSHQPGALLRLYTRYLRQPSERDRRRILRRGHPVPDPRRGGSWQ